MNDDALDPSKNTYGRYVGMHCMTCGSPSYGTDLSSCDDTAHMADCMVVVATTVVVATVAGLNTNVFVYSFLFLPPSGTTGGPSPAHMSHVKYTFQVMTWFANNQGVPGLDTLFLLSSLILFSSLLISPSYSR